MSGAGTGKLTGCNSTGDILLKGRIMGIFFVCEKQSFTSGPTLMACHEKFGPPPPDNGLSGPDISKYLYLHGTNISGIG